MRSPAIWSGSLAAVAMLAACQPADVPMPRREVPIPAASPPRSASVIDRLPPASAAPAPTPAVVAAAPELASAVADASVTVEVKTALGRDRELQGIEADTVNGTVVLRGEVSTPQARERAVWVTAQVNGVRQVHDNVRVERTYLR